MIHKTKETAPQDKQTIFSWLNKHFITFHWKKFVLLLRPSTVLIHMILLLKMLPTDLRNNKPMNNNSINRKDHLIKSDGDTGEKKYF